MKQKHPQLEAVNFDTKVLRYIIAIVDEKSLSRAAEKLYLSQPALSRHLRNIEQVIGTPLFFRKHNTLQLTNAGKIFINGARSILHIEEEALKKLRADRHARQSNIYIAAESLFYDYLRQEVHPLLRQTHPDISLYLTRADGDEIRRLVNDGTVDIGLFFGTPVDTPFASYEPLFYTELVFCAASGSTALSTAQANGFHLSDFAGEPLMLCDDGYLHRAQERILQENSISSPDIYCKARLPVLIDLVRLGYGNVILPREAVPFAPPDQVFSFDPPVQCSGILAQYKRRATAEAVQSYTALVKESLCHFPLPT